MDLGELGEARNQIESLEHLDTYSAYSLALIEYLACYVLEEEDSLQHTVKTALRAAYECNPHVAAMLASGSVFEELTDPSLADDLDEWTSGSVEEALHYCVHELSCWNDAEGSREYVHSWSDHPLASS